MKRSMMCIALICCFLSVQSTVVYSGFWYPRASGGSSRVQNTFKDTINNEIKRKMIELRSKVMKKQAFPDSVSNPKISHEDGNEIFYFEVRHEDGIRRFTLTSNKSFQRYKLCFEGSRNGTSYTSCSEDAEGSGIGLNIQDEYSRADKVNRRKNKNGSNEPAVRFHLIIACFSDNVVARNALSMYVLKGYSRAKVISEGGKYRISINSFDSEEKAKEEAERIGAGVWVFKSTTAK